MPRVQPHQQVLVTIQVEGYATTDDDPKIFPVGTQFIGVWLPEQPASGDYHIESDEIDWEISPEHVAIQCPLPAFPPGFQVNLAHLRARDGDQARQESDLVRAAILYAQAIAEYLLAGWEEKKLAEVRMKRASILAELGRYEESILELERAACAFEEAAFDPAERRFNSTGYLDYAEGAAEVLQSLGSVYLLAKADKAKLHHIILPTF